MLITHTHKAAKMLKTAPAAAAALLALTACTGTGPGTDEEASPASGYAEGTPEGSGEPEAAEFPEQTPAEAVGTVSEERKEPEPIVLSGSGDKVVTLDSPLEEPGIAEVEHTGGANFAVWSVDDAGGQIDLHVNVIGSYEGTVAHGLHGRQDIAAFEVTADGPWEMRLLPFEGAREWSDPEAEGTGDDVLRLTEPSEGLESVSMTHSGSGNFAVWSHGGSFPDLLANEIGSYEGESLLPGGTELVVVEADGAWTLSRE